MQLHCSKGGSSAGLLWPHRTLPLTPRALPSAGKEAYGELFQGADPAGNHNYRKMGLLFSWISSLSRHAARSSAGMKGQEQGDGRRARRD